MRGVNGDRARRRSFNLNRSVPFVPEDSHPMCLAVAGRNEIVAIATPLKQISRKCVIRPCHTLLHSPMFAGLSKTAAIAEFIVIDAPVIGSNLQGSHLGRGAERLSFRGVLRESSWDPSFSAVNRARVKVQSKDQRVYASVLRQEPIR